MKLFPLFILFSWCSFGQTQTTLDQKRDSIIQKGLDHYFDKDTIGLKESNKELVKLYQLHTDSLSLAKIYHFKALVHRIQNRLDSSYYYYNRSKDISIILKDSLEVGRRLLSMGYMQNNERDYAGAQVVIVNALEFLEPLKEITYTGDCYNVLGNILVNKKEFEEGRNYYKKAKELFKKSSVKSFKERWNLHLLNNIGNSYLDEGKFQKALEYLNEGLNTPNVFKDHRYVYKLLLGNSAACNYNIGKKEEAWDALNELLELRKKEDGPFRQSIVHDNFAFYYMKENNHVKALQYSRKSYALAVEGNNNRIAQLALNRLIKLTSGKESKQYFEKYTNLRDMLYEREFKNKEQFALIRYETEKIDLENKDLKIQSEKEKAETERQKQQKIISWLFSIVAVLGLGFSYTYFRARRKKLMYEAQLQKATAREEERQQIAKSLHDEVAGDLRMLHQKLSKTALEKEAKSIEKIKDNVRNLSHQLSSVSFDELSFKDQLINLISDHFSLDFRISVEGIDTVSWKEINNTIKRTLYLCIRESLQNTLKYAEATKFFISFSAEKKEILLILWDNGKGFDQQKGKKGIGLKNLKERVEEIHGTFQIESSEEGTRTTVSIPINGK